MSFAICAVRVWLFTVSPLSDFVEVCSPESIFIVDFHFGRGARQLRYLEAFTLASIFGGAETRDEGWVRKESEDTKGR